MLISQFYKNQDIFITGATGFVGKALVEKILRSIPNVGRIFLLLRAKKGKTAQERLQVFIKDPIFDRLHREKPQAFRHLVGITGDCSQLKLGISPTDMELLNNVSIIFHSAACVRFDDPLKNAILLNTRGTYELIKIALSLQDIKAFVHISTTYCNPDKHAVQEKVYPPYADWRTTIKLAETYDTDLLNILNMKYSDNQPNTYTFTKSLSEQIINEYKDKLPLVILRPSIVISSVEEPVPGWIDNFNGPMGMLLACGVGIMRTSYSDPDIISDFIPVDIVVRSLIVAAYKRGLDTLQHVEENELTVYNCASNGIYSVTADEIVRIGKEKVFGNPMEKTLWVPGGGITRCRYWNFIKLMTIQISMAIVADFGLKLLKMKPMLLRLQRRIYEANMALNYFMVTHWDFKNDKFRAIQDVIPKSELNTFSIWHYADNFDVFDFYDKALKGAKVYLLKEPAECTPGAMRRFRILAALNYLIQLIGGLLLLRFIVRYFYLNILPKFV